MARLLFVHAHPDDETLATGVAIAHYVSRGHDVHVLTCTLGDEGEVIPQALAHLRADPDALADFRRRELADAMARLGARHTVLGAGAHGHAPWRDSGMAGSPSADHPRAFAAADPREPGALIAHVLHELRPDVLVTYDVGGSYGHPDHIQTRRAVVAALAQLPIDQFPGRLFEVVTPLSWAREDRAWLAGVVAAPGVHVPTLDEPYAVSVVPDDELDAFATHVVVDEQARDRQAHALAAHRTQVVVHDGYYELSNRIAHRLPGREAYVRLDPQTGGRLPREDEAWVSGLWHERWPEG